jgi:plastocyanin
MELYKKCVWGFGMAAAIVLAAACGDDGSSDMSPSPNPGGGANTITITSSGVSPKSLTVSRGSQVTFVNNDSRSHDMSSDPHPAHTDCPEIDSVGVLNTGQSRQTSNLNTARTCGYHDHNDPSNSSLQGTIVIQ